MTIRLGVVMDPIQSIHYQKDSTLAMLWEAEKREWEIYYFEQKDLFIRDGIPFGRATQLKVFQDSTKWVEFLNRAEMPLADLTILLMRKDPPFNEEYIYTTYVLEHAERLGVLVANRPQSLRDANEKLFATRFPQCMPKTIVTQSKEKLHAFMQEYQEIVCKPLNSMGGTNVFRVKQNDANTNAIFDLLTQQESLYMMAQQFIPDVVKGDKRILMIDGEPVSYVLARVPSEHDWRGNLAVGAKGVVQALSERDRWICAEVGPTLKSMGLYFVGLDVIGDYLTEINVTSPTCIREIDEGANLNISAMLMDKLKEKI
ncbi:MAG: hypothetical protein ACD_46C00248G0002 [uncultured bacterium]|nr:MAG: hypothetical protein ACD_46C00248G0002 [uncultured bacterium]